MSDDPAGGRRKTSSPRMAPWDTMGPCRAVEHVQRTVQYTVWSIEYYVHRQNNPGLSSVHTAKGPQPRHDTFLSLSLDILALLCRRNSRLFRDQGLAPPAKTLPTCQQPECVPGIPAAKQEWRLGHAPLTLTLFLF